ncbi:MAG TPA: NfeD family protein [Mycobacteriales bacterium]|nr:NfeD family protein [Mycobacteriales bacterium]
MDFVPAWLVWLIAAGVLAIAEALSLNLFLIMLAGAALVAAGVAVVGAGTAVQVGVFAVVAIGLIGVVRPLARRRLELPSTERTGIEALKGRNAIVIRTVDQHGGRVKLAGEEWSAEAYDPTQVLQVGTTVQVMEIRGATAMVWSHT